MHLNILLDGVERCLVDVIGSKFLSNNRITMLDQLIKRALRFEASAFYQTGRHPVGSRNTHHYTSVLSALQCGQTCHWVESLEIRNKWDLVCSAYNIYLF